MAAAAGRSTRPLGLINQRVVNRPTIPADVIRAVLVEAGHRCAIPTCRATTTEVAHIESWATSQDNSLENLIALCPNCHTRFDQKKDIDAKSMRIYKRNLALLNYRYGDLERRVFEFVARSDARIFVVGAGGDLQLANAARDGLIKVTPSYSYGLDVTLVNGNKINFPMSFVCEMTAAGLEFVKQYAHGIELK
jgi:hypothetical protein